MDPGLFFEFIAQLFRLSVVFCFFVFFLSALDRLVSFERGLSFRILILRFVLFRFLVLSRPDDFIYLSLVVE